MYNKLENKKVDLNLINTAGSLDSKNINGNEVQITKAISKIIFDHNDFLLIGTEISFLGLGVIDLCFIYNDNLFIVEHKLKSNNTFPVGQLVSYYAFFQGLDQCQIGLILKGEFAKSRKRFLNSHEKLAIEKITTKSICCIVLKEGSSSECLNLRTSFEFSAQNIQGLENKLNLVFYQYTLSKGDLFLKFEEYKAIGTTELIRQTRVNYKNSMVIVLYELIKHLEKEFNDRVQVFVFDQKHRIELEQDRNFFDYEKLLILVDRIYKDYGDQADFDSSDFISAYSIEIELYGGGKHPFWKPTFKKITDYVYKLDVERGSSNTKDD